MVRDGPVITVGVSCAAATTYFSYLNFVANLGVVGNISL